MNVISFKSVIDPRFRFPRTLRIVEQYVGSRGLALRYVGKASAGEAMYLKIVREAFSRRHRWQEFKARSKS